MPLPGVQAVAGGLKGSGTTPPGPDASELSASLGYLKPEDIAQIERAYETARAAHAGQFRKSGEPYITHPLAVAKILAEWHLDPQALMAALLHDVVEDTPTTKTEIAQALRQGRGRAGRRRLEDRPHRVRDAAARAGRELQEDAARDGARRARHPHQARRPPAQHAHARRRARGEAGADRARDARDLRAHRQPAGPERHLLRARGPGLPLPAPDALPRAREGAQARARQPARRRGQAQGRDPGAPGGLPRRGAGARPREAHLLDLQEDAGEEHLVLRGVRHLRLPHPRARRPGLLPRAGRAAHALQAHPRQVQGLHRHPEGERLPVAAHDALRPVRHARRGADPHARDAQGGRGGRRLALALQERRRARRRTCT